MAAPPRVPHERQQRAMETRDRILESAVTVLVDEGYRAATTSRVQEVAGVSRGALLHHFPTRLDLLLAATHHLAARRGRWLAERAARIGERSDRIDATIRLLWDAMNGPLFAAATELWVAARTDEELRTALIGHERRLGVDARHSIATAMGLPDPDEPALVAALDMTLQVLRGAALTALLRDDARWERQVVTLATQTFRDRLQRDRPEPNPQSTATGGPRPGLGSTVDHHTPTGHGRSA